jgi:adenine/guanine phosphoribosyltransferase-like PRPP-binding protein
MNFSIPCCSRFELLLKLPRDQGFINSRLPFLMMLPIVVLVASCTTDEANRYYSPVRYAEKAPAEVAILRSRPDREFIVIADFQSRGESATAMQKKAAKIGADAVIVVFLGGFYSLNDRWANADSQHDSFSHITATAIKYK